jgi:hypothetical protein
MGPTLSTDLRSIADSWGDRAYLSGVVLSCCCDRQWRPSGERKLPGQRYLMKSLSSSVPKLLNITNGKSFLPGGTYPLIES